MNNERINRRVEEERRHMEINGHPDVTWTEAHESLMLTCGHNPETGHCSKVGTEYCDWECPFTWEKDDE